MTDIQLEIKITNWEKFNPRGDSKRPSWFRCENDFFTSQSIYGLTASQKLVWLLCMCLASKKNGGAITVLVSYAASLTGASESEVFEAIEKLEQRQCLTSNLHEVVRACPDLPATYERTNVRTQRTERTNKLQPESAGADNPVGTDLEILGFEEKPPKRKREAASAATWQAYSLAYFDRYGNEPKRNAMVNGQMAKFVERLGIEDAPHVAKFYLTLNQRPYLNTSHSVGMLCKDAESLYTQWKTGRTIAPFNRAEQVSDSNKSLMEKVLKGEI